MNIRYLMRFPSALSRKHKYTRFVSFYEKASKSVSKQRPAPRRMAANNTAGRGQRSNKSKLAALGTPSHVAFTQTTYTKITTEITTVATEP